VPLIESQSARFVSGGWVGAAATVVAVDCCTVVAVADGLAVAVWLSLTVAVGALVAVAFLGEASEALSPPDVSALITTRRMTSPVITPVTDHFTTELQVL
jgi:hypothetical protein